MNRALATRRAAPVVAIAFGLVTLVIGMVTVPLDRLIHQAGTGGPLTDTLVTAAAVVPATAVGTLLAARRPRNPIGWLLLGIIIVGFSPTSQYLILDYRMHHGTLPLGGVMVILNETWPLLLFFVSTLLWIFPDGTLPPGRWHRPAVVLLVAGLVIALAASTSGVLAVAGHYVRIQATGDLGGHRPAALVVLAVVVIAGTLISWLAWIVSQVLTYRHASGERRQQLKWLYSGAAILVVSLVIGVFIVPLAMGEAPGLRHAAGGRGADHHRGGRPAGVHGSGGAEVPAVRAQPRDQPGGLVHADHGPTGRGVLRAGPAGHPRPAVQDDGRGSGLHADHRGAVQPASPAGAEPGRPPVQPLPLRRRGDRGRVQRPAPADRGPGHCPVSTCSA